MLFGPNSYLISYIPPILDLHASNSFVYGVCDSIVVLFIDDSDAVGKPAYSIQHLYGIDYLKEKNYTSQGYH